MLVEVWELQDNFFLCMLKVTLDTLLTQVCLLNNDYPLCYYYLVGNLSNMKAFELNSYSRL